MFNTCVCVCVHVSRINSFIWHMVSVIIIVVRQVVAGKRKCERVKRVERIITPVAAVRDNERNTARRYIAIPIILLYAHAINNSNIIVIIIVGHT